MKTNANQWKKPELLVLTRSNPEEAVLTGCKNVTINGPKSGQKYCQGPVAQCTNVAGS